MLAEDELREAVLLIFANKQVYLDDIKSLIPLRTFLFCHFENSEEFTQRPFPYVIRNLSINDNYHILNYFRICLTQ